MCSYYCFPSPGLFSVQRLSLSCCLFFSSSQLVICNELISAYVRNIWSCVWLQVTVPSESDFPRQGYGCLASPWRLCEACRCADCISFLGSPYEANGNKDWGITSFAVCPCTLSLLHTSLQQSWFVSLVCWMWSWSRIVIWKSVFFFSRKTIVISDWLNDRIYCS